MQEKRTVADWVTERPSRARVFEWFGIDYCCNGGMSLENACAKSGVKQESVMAELEKSDRENSRLQEKDWSTVTPAELVQHIVDHHHTYLRVELPRIRALVNKVNNAHQERHPDLRLLQSEFYKLSRELDQHLDSEESFLFPLISAMDNGREARAKVGRAAMELEKEHLEVAAALHHLRRLTDDYKLPPDGCETYRVMLHSLQEFELDTHQHVHKENNILFRMLTV